MKFYTAFVSLMIALAMLSAGQCYGDIAYLQHHGKWEEKQSRTVADFEKSVPIQNVRLSKYGGFADVKVKATGFFRTAKLNGRWWLIDPEGHPFISVGVCTVSPHDILPGPLKNKFGGRDKWAKQITGFLKDNGFNTIGCWSDMDLVSNNGQRMTYMANWSFMATYKQKRPKKNGQRGEPHRTIPIFDPEFVTYCDRYAQKLAALKDDPYLVGHFSDNELPFRPNALENYLKLPTNDLGYKVAKAWWDKRRKEQGNPNRKIAKKDNRDFQYKVALRYYTVVAAAMRKYDPNHLYFGSRIHGRTITKQVFMASTPLDVVSVNYYHRWSPEPRRLRNWVKLSGKPFLCSEWYAMTIDSPKKYIRGAGFKVKTERCQGLYYQNYTIGLLEHPGCVGWQWYKYTDDWKPRPLGIYSRDGKIRETLLQMMREVNKQAYPLAMWFSKKSQEQATN